MLFISTLSTLGLDSSDSCSICLGAEQEEVKDVEEVVFTSDDLRLIEDIIWPEGVYSGLVPTKEYKSVAGENQVLTVNLSFWVLASLHAQTTTVKSSIKPKNFPRHIVSKPIKSFDAADLLRLQFARYPRLVPLASNDYG
ncbi:hypothetical protein C8R45DRAFT_937370 [Mycena sanguinolenta]|nr:hypothetical protein C8R45DRAFT_937370 [Mycena sanguinolenta]